MEHTSSSTNNNNYKNNSVGSAIETILLFLCGILFLLFPLVISSHTTNSFVFPKELLLLGFVLLALILWCAKIVFEGRILIRRTPLDIPIILFLLFVLTSSLLSTNHYDALISFSSLCVIFISYFIIVNISRRENALVFLLSSLTVSGVVVAALTILSFVGVYILPFPYAHDPNFTVLGSYFDQALYLVLILGVSGYLGSPLIRGRGDAKAITFAAGFLAILMGLVVTIIRMLTIQHPIILPFETGFQVALATISQEQGRVFQGFFFGSGFGTFVNDFTRFKLPTFNAYQNLWYLTFQQSSSFVLELLTTTGILGLLGFIFILIGVFRNTRKFFTNPMSISIFLGVIIAFSLPMSFSLLTLFVFLLALFASIDSFIHPKNHYDLELQTFALKRYLLTDSSDHHKSQSNLSKFISVILCVFIFVFIGFFGYFGTMLLLSDVSFQNSLIAASQNNGIKTYQDQIKAIQQFGFRDQYYRAFSQTNLALANSIIALQPKDKKLTSQQQQTLYSLIQQSINAGRAATSLAPETVANWQNLSSIYRALIGFGQNADQFALATEQQAIALDSTNPQEYISMGGLYYQIGQYDLAIQEFTTAASLKPDFPNAYYNWGHALEQKGNLNGALQEYQNVKKLVANDPANLSKISGEIDILNKKISENNSQQGPLSQQETAPAQQTNSQQLDLNKPQNVFPTQKPQVKIPAPTIVSPVPTKSASPSPSR